MNGTVHLFDQLPQVNAAEQGGERRGSAPVRSSPLVGVIRNPRSHRNVTGKNPAPDLPGVLVETPARRSELQGVLADFAARQIDYLAIDGGDGTVRDVLTCGAGVFGESWPELIVIPSGKTNALAYDLGVPVRWTLVEALEAVNAGKTVQRQPMIVAESANLGAQVRGFVLGAGAFAKAIELGQDAHRLGAFDAAAVGVTTAWTVLQTLFGRRGNRWRQSTRMRLRDAQGKELPHSGLGSRDERFMLFASTMERFPAGLKPFGTLEGGLRLTMIDAPIRRLLLGVPVMLFGRISERQRQMGVSTLKLDALDFEIEEGFILDGEAFPPGQYHVSIGSPLRFLVP